MDKLESELETRDEFELDTRYAAEQFRKELEARIPKGIGTERVEHRGEQADYCHLSFLRHKTLAGCYSFERDGKKYICTLDLRRMPEVQIEVPKKTAPTGVKFIRYLKQGFVHDGTKGNWTREGFKTRGGLILNPTLLKADEAMYFAHQSISREDGTLALRYDAESDEENGKKFYVCHLDIRMTKEEHEKLFNLFDIWIHYHFNQKFSGQETQHHESPQPACELAKQT